MEIPMVPLCFLLVAGLGGCLDPDGGSDHPNVIPPPPDTISGFSLVNPYADAEYHIDKDFMGWKCTSAVSQPAFEKRGDSTYGRMQFLDRCSVKMGTGLYEDTLEDTLEFTVLGNRIFNFHPDTGWVENPPWKPYRSAYPPQDDIWHPFERMPTDSLVKVEFLGDSLWAFARKFGSGSSIPGAVSYLYIQGFGLIYADDRYQTTIRGNATGEVIKLIRYKSFQAGRIQADIDRILGLVEPNNSTGFSEVQ